MGMLEKVFGVRPDVFPEQLRLDEFFRLEFIVRFKKRLNPTYKFRNASFQIFLGLFDRLFLADYRDQIRIRVFRISEYELNTHLFF